MARALYSDVLIWYGGVYPVPTTVWTESSITDLCTVADTLIDQVTYPEKIPTSGDEAKEIAVSVVTRLVYRANLVQKGDQAANFYKVFDDLTMLLIDNLLKNTTTPIIADTVDMIPE